MKLSGKITVDRRSVLGFSSTPMLILFKQEVLRFFISFCTLSAFLAFSTYGELHTLFLGNCNCSWHWVNKFLSNLNELHGRFFSQQNYQIISFPNSMLIVVLNIWHFKWRLFDRGQSWKQYVFVLELLKFPPKIIIILDLFFGPRSALYVFSNVSFLNLIWFLVSLMLNYYTTEIFCIFGWSKFHMAQIVFLAAPFLEAVGFNVCLSSSNGSCYVLGPFLVLKSSCFGLL